MIASISVRNHTFFIVRMINNGKQWHRTWNLFLFKQKLSPYKHMDVFLMQCHFQDKSFWAERNVFISICRSNTSARRSYAPQLTYRWLVNKQHRIQKFRYTQQNHDTGSGCAVRFITIGIYTIIQWISQAEIVCVDICESPKWKCQNAVIMKRTVS